MCDKLLVSYAQTATVGNVCREGAQGTPNFIEDLGVEVSIVKCVYSSTCFPCFSMLRDDQSCSLLSHGPCPLPPALDSCSLLWDCRFLALLQADLGIFCPQVCTGTRNSPRFEMGTWLQRETIPFLYVWNCFSVCFHKGHDFSPLHRGTPPPSAHSASEFRDHNFRLALRCTAR